MVRTGEWIKQGWALVQQDLGMQIVIGIVISLINGTGVGWLLVPALTCGWYYVLLQKLRDPSYTVSISDVFTKGFEVFVPALVGGILVGLFASLGVLACVVGVIVVAALLVFPLPLIMDKRMDFWPAIQLSFETTKKDWLSWCLFVLGLGGINLLGALCCGVGVFFTYPITVAAIAVAYRETFSA